MIKKLKTGIISLILLSIFSQSTVQAASYYISFPSRLGENVLKYTFDGTALKDTMNIENTSDSEIEVSLYPTDSLRSTDGGTGFKSQAQRQKNIGTWIKFNENIIKIPAKSKKSVEFTIEPKENTQPGSYIGGIAIQNKGSSSNSEGGPSVKVLTRNIQKILVTIPGEVINSFKTINLKAVSKLNYLEFNHGIKNTGNSLLKINGKLEVFHEQNLIQTFNINEITINPEEVSILSNRINSPTFGNIKAKLDLNVSAYNAVEDKYIDIGNVNEETNTYFIPWFIIFGIIILIALIVALLIGKKLALKKYLKSCEQYKVGEGDTLANLEEKYGMNWKKIAQINKLKAPYTLTPGSIIFIKNEKTK